MKPHDHKLLIGDVIHSLRSSHAHYRMVPPNGPEHPDLRWWQDEFPIATWGRVLWNAVPHSECSNWARAADAAETLRELCSNHKLGNSQVVVVWSNATQPCLELSLETVLLHAEPIIDADFDTWIICRAGGWCIEIYHEGELCFGYTPAQAVFGSSLS